MNLVNRVLSRLVAESKIFATEIFLKYFISNAASFNLNELFKGKRVAIIGPADSTIGTGLGNYIDQFDVVVRINNSPLVVANSENSDDIGSRTDVLFHCLQEANGKLGGRLDFELLKSQGVDNIVSYVRINESIHNYWILNFFFKYRNIFKNKLLLVPEESYRELYKLLGNKKPTTGLVALFALLKTEFKELYISGFTFYQTGYVKNYTLGSDNASGKIDINKPMGSHGSPIVEFNLFKKLMQDKSEHVKLDNFLNNICYGS